MTATPITLLVDSGASDNMVNSPKYLTELKPIPEKIIVLGNGDSVRATQEETMILEVTLRGGGPTVIRTAKLRRVLLVPGLKANLISCSALCRDGYNLTFNKKVCVVWNESYIEKQGTRCGGVYVVHGVAKKPEQGTAMTANSGMKELWHDRLGHASVSSIEQLARNGAVIGLSLKRDVQDHHDCAGCVEGKQHKLSLKKNEMPSATPGEVIHSDVSGRISVASLGGSRYYVTFIDEYSNYVTVFPIAKKSDVLERFQLFRVWFERKYDCKIKTLQCDGGGEYEAYDEYLKDHGIERPPNPSYCPEVNGMAERANRTLMESARAMLHHAGIPKFFWAEAADIRNRFPCPGKDSVTYEMLTGKKPRVDHIRVFGSRAWVHVPKKKRKKLDAKSTEGIAVACMENSQCKVWLEKTKSPVISRHLRIVENTFPSRTWFSSVNEDNEALDKEADDELEEVTEEKHNQRHTDTSTVSSRPLSHRPVTVSPSTQDLLIYVPEVQSRHRTEEDSTVHDSDRENTPEEDLDDHRRYPRRARNEPDYYNPGNAFLSGVDNEPTTVEEALRMSDVEKWREAIQEEFKSLEEHNTWGVDDLPKHSKVLPSRFVFKRKMKSDGTVAKYKARLVAKGFMQGPVDHTYSPVVDFTTVRIALAVVVQKGYYVHQMDVKTAFLHGIIDEDVYFFPPQGSGIKLKPGQALKLKKGLYGLKQAPKLWYKKWKEVMVQLGLQSFVSDKCVFRKGDLWVLLYVDDVIIIGKSMIDIDDMKKELSSVLKMKDLGELHTFLALMIAGFGQSSYWILQHSHITSCVRDTWMVAWVRL